MLVKTRRKKRRVVDAVHHDQQLVERELAAAAHHPAGDALVRRSAGRNDGYGTRLGRALREELVAPGARLEDHVAARVERAVRPEEEEVLERRWRHRRGDARAAPADGVDLVDEDDALAAPFRRELLRLAREVADDDHVHAHERLREARAGDRDEGTVEVRRDRLREHRLARAGRAEEEEPALALAARRLELLARLPERDDPANLLLRLLLAAHVLELDAPVRVAGLEAVDLRDPHQQHRAHEDQEVEDEEERQDEA